MFAVKWMEHRYNGGKNVATVANNCGSHLTILYAQVNHEDKYSIRPQNEQWQIV